MPADEFDKILRQFRQSLVDCRELYVSSGKLAASEPAVRLSRPAERFVELMDDLHRALLVKVFVSIGECDRSWSRHEQQLAEALIRHLWRRDLKDQALRQAITEMAEKAMSLRWYALFRPFDEIPPLRNRIGELETLVIRLSHLIARVDGPIKAVEAARIQSIQDEIHRHLRPVPIDEPAAHAAADQLGAQVVDELLQTADQLPVQGKVGGKASGKNPLGHPAVSDQPQKTSAELLAEALAELDALIGLEGVKHEVRTLANFIKVQNHRVKAGLPTASLTLHMVFTGNPGTGKTSVARIVGRILGAMGVLSKGHLVETDRSGLVAEYAGQTGPKSQKKISEALDGVLFIDEAYALISKEGNDAYGQEAVQTLLKRMEDDRDRLVVILAGYPDEIASLLESNPGLSSRFARRLEFTDYAPVELARIFSLMCEKNHYRLGPLARAKTMLGLRHLHQVRDEHFGNGRTVRNLFEHAIRRQANRISCVTELSVEELSTLEAEDVEFCDFPPELFAPLSNGACLEFHIACPHCRHCKDMPYLYLGKSVRCPKCKKTFTAEWGDPVADASPASR